MEHTKKYHIIHLGKILHTDHWYNLSADECNSIREKYYKKPDFELVKKNFKSLCKGNKMVFHIMNYYIKDLMVKVRLHTSRWSIEEVLQSDDLIRYFYSRTLTNNKIYKEKNSILRNFELALSLSGGRVALKPSNFPIKTADYILECYNTNNNYYDFSCGWGIRMLSSMKQNINYYGTDPNYLLIERLKDINRDYNEVNKTNTFIDIRCQGSETLIPEWKGKMGLIFSSPPYYNLEDYLIGEQSINGKTYEEWLEQYILETLKNCKEYLTDDGYLLINVKNFSEYKLYDDILELGKSVGFDCIGYEILKNNMRPSSKIDLNTDEKIMIFVTIKEEYESKNTKEIFKMNRLPPPTFKSDYVYCKESLIEGAGLGAFAKIDIKKGKKIYDYEGEEIPYKEMKLRYKDDLEYTYQMRRVQKAIIAKDHPYLTNNIVNYVNEGDPENVELKKRALYAKLNIKKNDELYLHYPKTYNRYWL